MVLSRNESLASPGTPWSHRTGGVRPGFRSERPTRHHAGKTQSRICNSSPNHKHESCSSECLLDKLPQRVMIQRRAFAKRKSIFYKPSWLLFKIFLARTLLQEIRVSPGAFARSNKGLTTSKSAPPAETPSLPLKMGSTLCGPF